MSKQPKFKGTKTAAEYQRGEMIRDILKLISAGIAASGTAPAAPNTLQLLDYLDPKGRVERNKIWNAIRYLEQKGDIEVQTDEKGDDYVYLTSKGRTRLNADEIWQLSVEKPRQWDQRWRLVLFDFPSTARRRHEFRAKLEDLGFEMYQRSVFIFPYECREEVFTVAKWLDLDDYIRYIVATEIHDMRRFIKLFDLV
jgi:DNA-binding transcriptional regulator PaaX